jgi:hypothetical protein
VEFGFGEGRMGGQVDGFEVGSDSLPAVRSTGRPAWLLRGECRRRTSPRVSADGECLV